MLYSFWRPLGKASLMPRKNYYFFLFYASQFQRSNVAKSQRWSNTRNRVSLPFFGLKTMFDRLKWKNKRDGFAASSRQHLIQPQIEIFFRILQYEQKGWSWSDTIVFQFPKLPVLLLLGDSEGYIHNMEIWFQYILCIRMQDGNWQVRRDLKSTWIPNPMKIWLHFLSEKQELPGRSYEYKTLGATDNKDNCFIFSWSVFWGE